MAHDPLDALPISRETRTAAHFELIAASADYLDPRPRALYIATGGTATFISDNGNTEAAVPLTTGTIIPCQIAKITVITDAVIYGLYG